MSTTFHSTWLQGANAARAGASAADCPYPPSEYFFVAWFNGWSNAMHNMAKEAATRAPSNEDLF